MNELNFSGFEPINTIITGSLDKTAAQKAGETLLLDSYTNGIEAGLGILEAPEHTEKTACQIAGREIMSDFIPNIFLSK